MLSTVEKVQRSKQQRVVEAKDKEPEVEREREPGVAERSAGVPARQPTPSTAFDARRRTREDPAIRLRRSRVDVRGPDRAPPPGPQNPLGSSTRTHATRTLSQEPRPNARDPYVRYKQEIRDQLARAGVPGRSNDRVHVDDVDKEHGESVARTLAGRTSLVGGSEVSLNTRGLPGNFQSKHLSPAEMQRYQSFDQRMGRLFQSNPSIDDVARLGAEGFARSVTEKQLRLENIRNHTPSDGKKTFVNMSWGETPHETADKIMGSIAMSPPSSKLRSEVTKFLGREPRSEQDMQKVMKGLIYPAVERAMGTPEHKAQMGAARKGLEEELARGREKNILVFNAAGNAFSDATQLGKPNFSVSSVSGIKGMINVGSVDLNGRGTRDDRVSSFSSDGRIDIAAPGKDIPVGLRNGRVERVEGTSFASPNAVDVARAISAANPRLSADDIARLITDPRAANDIPGTSRDGRGHVDPFAAVMLARDPTLTRAQIDALRRR
jgi:hypothetical protein